MFRQNDFICHHQQIALHTLLMMTAESKQSKCPFTRIAMALILLLFTLYLLGGRQRKIVSSIINPAKSATTEKRDHHGAHQTKAYIGLILHSDITSVYIAGLGLSY